MSYSPCCAPTSTGWETKLPISESDMGIERTAYPAHCVDYLTHDWTDEDLARSWRAVTGHNKVSSNCTRLENASWRIWTQKRHNIPTLNPAELNWHKDNDTTWLYGPLLRPTQLTSTSAPVSKSNSFVGTVNSIGLKPALKKRSSVDHLRQHTDPLPQSECKKDLKLRFSSQVQQFVAVDSPESVSPSLSRRESVVQVASTTIKYSHSPHSSSYHFDDDVDEFPPYAHLYHTSSQPIPALPTPIQPPPAASLPLIQSCYNAVSTTVGVLSWARNMLF